MLNEPLRRALSRAGLTYEEAALRLGVDPKTVQRWVTLGRVPHARTRRAISGLVAVDEADLWPPSHPSTEDAGALAVLPSRASIPAGEWLRMVGMAARHVDVLAWAATFFHQLPGVVARLAEAAGRGAEVRLCFGDPAGAAVARREVEEAPFLGPGVLAAKVRVTLAYFSRLVEVDGIEVRLHDAVVYASLFRFDDDMVANPHVFGRPASENPALRLRRPGSVFDAYAASFDAVWSEAAAWKGEDV